jgi:hypothetical protein
MESPAMSVSVAGMPSFAATPRRTEISAEVKPKTSVTGSSVITSLPPKSALSQGDMNALTFLFFILLGEWSPVAKARRIASRKEPS